MDTAGVFIAPEHKRALILNSEPGAAVIGRVGPSVAVVFQTVTAAQQVGPRSGKRLTGRVLVLVLGSVLT